MLLFLLVGNLFISQASAQVPWELMDCDSYPKSIDGMPIKTPPYCPQPKLHPPKPPKPAPAPQKPKSDLGHFKPNLPAPTSNPLNDYKYSNTRVEYSPSHPVNDMSADLINQGANDFFRKVTPKDHSHVYAKADQIKKATSKLKKETEKLAKAPIRASDKDNDAFLDQVLKDEIAKLTKGSKVKAPPKKSKEPKATSKVAKEAKPKPPKYTSPDINLASNGLFRRNLEDILHKLNQVEPKYERQITAKHLGLVSVQEADNSFVAGKMNNANYFTTLAEGFLDIALGLNPFTGVAKNAFELISGKNLVTGLELSEIERSLAFVGCITFGAAPSVVKMTTAFNKILKGASEIIHNRKAIEAAVTKGATLASHAAPALTDFKKSFKITEIVPSSVLNAKFTNPPFKPDSYVVNFVTTKDTKFVRVFTEGSSKAPGNWMVKPGEIKGLTPEQIRVKLNLPSVPTHVVDVHVPSDSVMSRGMTHFNQWDQVIQKAEGQVQYLLGTELKPKHFTNIRPIGNKL